MLDIENLASSENLIQLKLWCNNKIFSSAVQARTELLLQPVNNNIYSFLNPAIRCVFFSMFHLELKRNIASFPVSYSVSMIQLRVVNSENSYQCVLTDIFSVWFRVLSSHLNISLSVTFFSCGQSSTANYSTSNYSFSFLIKSQTKNPLADNPKATVLRFRREAAGRDFVLPSPC